MNPNQLLNLFVRKAKEMFGERVVSLYKFGSLGEHGDFSLCSDVDVVLMLDQITASDAVDVKQLWAALIDSKLDYAERLSLFWSSYHGDDFAQGRGRFPALDRLDLIRHARLLNGVDRRHELPVPTQADLVLESATFIAEFMLADGKLEEITAHAETILTKGARYFTKCVLFPVRLLFTIDHVLTIASNKEAVAYFNQAWHESVPANVIALVNFAYEARACPADEPVDYDLKALQPALQILYKTVIKAYANAAEQYDKPHVADALRKCEGALAVSVLK